jgi:hypothetical protein
MSIGNENTKTIESSLKFIMNEVATVDNIMIITFHFPINNIVNY